MGEPRGSLGGALGESGDQFVIYGQRFISSRKPHVLKPEGSLVELGDGPGGLGGTLGALGRSLGHHGGTVRPSGCPRSLWVPSGKPRGSLGRPWERHEGSPGPQRDPRTPPGDRSGPPPPGTTKSPKPRPSLDIYQILRAHFACTPNLVNNSPKYLCPSPGPSLWPHARCF